MTMTTSSSTTGTTTMTLDRQHHHHHHHRRRSIEAGAVGPDFLQDLLECSVCFEQLDITSKVLPCQHTFCKRCLEGILLTHRELRCPECRILVNVGGSLAGISDLPCNILLIRLLEGIKNGSGAGGASRRSSSTGSGSSSSMGRRGSTSRNSFRITQDVFNQQHQHQSGHQQAIVPSLLIQGRAITSYEAKPGTTEISFREGDLITIHRKIDANWSFGEVVSTGRIGLFPSSLVQVTSSPSTNSSDQHSQHPESSQNSVILPQVRALYDFSMDGRDTDGRECLSFKRNDIILFIRRVDDNWASGRIGDRVGIFPLNFVEASPLVSMLLRQQQQQQQSLSSSPSSCGTTKAMMMQPLPPPPACSSPGNNNCHQLSSNIHCNNNNNCSNSIINHENGQQQLQTEVQNQEFQTRPKCGQDGFSRIIYDVVVQSSSSSSGNNSNSSFRDQSSSISHLNEPKSEQNRRVEQIFSADTKPLKVVPTDNDFTEVKTAVVTTPKDVSISSNGGNGYGNTSSNSQLYSVVNPKRHSMCGTLYDSAAVVVHQRSVSHTPSSSTMSTAPPITGTGVIVTNPRFSMDVDSVMMGSTIPGDSNVVYGSTANATKSPPLPGHPFTALFDYKPQKSDELQLVRGQVYSVIEKCLDGWYRGTCLQTGSSGVFPGNYVQPQQQQSAMRDSAQVVQLTNGISIYHTPASSSSRFVGGSNNSNSEPHYQVVHHPSTSRRFSSSPPPPLHPKPTIYCAAVGGSDMLTRDTRRRSKSGTGSGGWRSSEGLFDPVYSAQSPSLSTPSSSLYSRPKPRTLPLNFSRDRRESGSGKKKTKRKSKSPGTVPPSQASTPSPQWQPVQVAATRSFSREPPFLPLDHHFQQNQHRQHHQLHRHQSASGSSSSSSSSPNILEQQQRNSLENCSAGTSGCSGSNTNDNNSKKVSSSFGSMMKKWAKIGSSKSSFPSPAPAVTGTKGSSLSSSNLSSLVTSANITGNGQTSPASSSGFHDHHHHPHPHNQHRYQNSSSIDKPCSDNTFPKNRDSNNFSSSSGLYSRPVVTASSSSSSHTRSGSCPARTTVVVAATTSSNGFPLPPPNRPLPAIPPPPSHPHRDRERRERYRAIAPYPPNSDFELGLEVGDVVIAHKKRDDGWIKGTLVRNGKTGLIPRNFLEVIQPPQSSSTVSTPSSTSTAAASSTAPSS